MKDYAEIGRTLSRAFDGEVPGLLGRATKIMQDDPELCNKIRDWDDLVWLLVEEFLNKNKGARDYDRDLLIRACALLGKKGGTQ